ncbi:hypothetical protein [Membranihabitans maritimus]|uniref:hypothetical protein n=1 Tax=Membranihabitans maritimus TaxID=2904244 RepID=UPI001F441D89|nr:hypothetical protein [Membranihabitans maritimus]
MNYNNRKFRPLKNSKNGEVSEDLIFHYSQEGNILTCKYSGANILAGHLIGLVDPRGNIDMRYHQVNKHGEIKTGICHSKPVVLANGKIQLLEDWEWTSGGKGKGTSVLEEL